jgi:hypothetical protein
MKNAILFGTLFTLFIMPVAAHADCVLKVPQDCTYKASTLSTSGEKSPGFVIEYDCQKPDGTIIKYMDWDFSIAKYLGFGRITVPRKTVFTPWDKDSIELNC